MRATLEKVGIILDQLAEGADTDDEKAFISGVKAEVDDALEECDGIIHEHFVVPMEARLRILALAVQYCQADEKAPPPDEMAERFARFVFEGFEPRDINPKTH